MEKAIYSIVEALNGLDQYAEERKSVQIHNCLSEYSDRLDLYCKELSGLKRRKSGLINRLIDEYLKKIMHVQVNKEIRALMKEFSAIFCEAYGIKASVEEQDRIKKLIDEVCQKMRKILDMTNEEIGIQKVNNVFDHIFDESYIRCGQESAKIVIEDENKKIEISFFRLNTDCCQGIERNDVINMHAYIISSPKDLEVLSRFRKYNFPPLSSKGLFETMVSPGAKINTFLTDKSLRLNLEKNQSFTIDRQKKILECKKKIETIMNGEFVQEKNSLRFREKGVQQSFSLANMSMGVQSLAMLERMLSYDLLDEGIFLILDEPEINLHPEWQLIYAQILVELQNILNLKIIITTHSPYFLRAIQYYAKQYSKSDVCHYYSAQCFDGSSIIENVDNKVSVLFQRLTAPLSKIMDFDDEE